MVTRIIPLLLMSGLSFGQTSRVIYSRFIGGKIDGWAEAAAIDSGGNTYVVGNSWSARADEQIPPDFPISPTSFFKERGRSRQGFLVKLSPSGKTIFSTLLPVRNAKAVALDQIGNVYIAGDHLWESHATAGAFQEKSHGGGDEHYAGEAFVMKIDMGGAKLLWATNLGGSKYEEAESIAVDSQSRVYVTGWTTSPDFPLTKDALQSKIASKKWDEGDAFVTVLEPDGKRMAFSTLFGNPANAWPKLIALDRLGAVYVSGNAFSGFPTTERAWRTSGSGAFAAKLEIQPARLVYSTFLRDDVGRTSSGSVNQGDHFYMNVQSAIVDDGGSMYITGYASPAGYRTTSGAYQRASKVKGVTAFVMRLNSAGTQQVFSTFLGGSTSEWGMGIGLDRQKRVYVTGRTSSSDFPTTPAAPQRRLASSAEDVFLAVLDPTGGHLEFSTLLGGPKSDFPTALAVTSTGTAVVAGCTGSRWFLRPTIRTGDSEMGRAFVVSIRPF
jgi:hypothetical protein